MRASGEDSAVLEFCFMGMTKTRWFIAAGCLLAFWLAAALWLAPALERALAGAGQQALQELSTGYEAPALHVSGQQIQVSGRVRSSLQKAKVLDTLRTQVRVPGRLGAALNPVQTLADGLEVLPYPPGWLFIAAHGPRGRLLGQAATPEEARDLATQLGMAWSRIGGYLDPQVQADPARHDEAPDVTATLAQPPLPRQDAGGDSAQAQIARIGGPWQRLIVDATDEVLHAQVLALGIDDGIWRETLLPQIGHLRRYQAEQRQLAQEAERQSRLPPPHVFLATRQGKLLARGEVATLALKRSLLNALIEAFPAWRVLDDLRVNAQRRSVGDFAPLAALDLPETPPASPAAKTLHLGISGLPWQPLDHQAAADTQPWQPHLPKDLPSALLQEDGKMVIGWLQGGTQGIPTLPARPQPSFLTLTLLPDKVILAGQVAEENVRTQIIDALHRKYAGRTLVLSEGLLARGTCEPSPEIQHTLLSLPDLPLPTSMGALAFARPGAVWTTRPASGQIIQPGVIASSGLLPADFPAAMAEDTFLDSFDHLRHHWKNLSAQGAQAADR
jgi:hypothetical protein